MIAKWARAYAAVLLVGDLLVLAATLVLHVNALAGRQLPYGVHGRHLLLGSFLVAFPAMFFAKERNVWRNEFKDCPGWVQIAVIIFMAYGIGVAIFQTVLFPSSGGPDDSWTITAIPLFIASMPLCVLYSVLWSGKPLQTELTQRARNSLIAAVLIVPIFIASHLGYLTPRK